MTKLWKMEVKCNTTNSTLSIRDKSIGGLSDEYFQITGNYISEKQLRNIYWGRAPSRAKYISIHKCF